MSRLAALLLALALCAAPLAAETVRVAPGALDHFRVIVSGTPAAGEPFTVRLEAVDAFDNLITDYAATGNGVRVSVVGRGTVTPVTVDAGQFSGGVARLSVTHPVAEAVTVRVMERDGRARGESTAITVRAGSIDHFDVAVPALARAGEPFALVLTARDRFNNLITDYADRFRGVALTADGAGKLTPPLVAASQFVDGTARVQVSYDAAEELNISVRDQERPAAGRSTPVRVTAGPLARFAVIAPRAGVAGAAFRVALEAKDAFGNTVTDYATRGRGAELSGSGSGRLEPLFVSPDQFRNGVAFATLAYTGSDNVIITASERGQRAVSGASEAIAFTAGALGSFTVEAPETAEAGIPFTVRVQAADVYGNIIRDFARGGQTVVLRHSGSLPEAETEIAAGQFIDGMASVSVTYRLAEPLTIVARQQQGSISGSSRTVTIQPGAPDHIRVTAPATAVAGTPFTVTLLAEDRYNNRVADFAARGMDVRVAVAGTVARDPEVVPAGRFSQGQAQAVISYQKAERIVVRAEDREGNTLGLSGPLTVSGGALAAFRVTAPVEATAGETFPVRLVAVDGFDNVITDYDRQGNGVKLAGNGVGTLVPVSVAPALFRDGVAVVACRYHTSEIISISAGEERGLAAGTSAPVRVQPGALDHFVLTAPAAVLAGQPFTLRLEAQDRYYNTLREYARSGAEVVLGTDRGGELTPATLGADAFAAGVATTSLTVTRAGDFRILARAGAAQGLSGALSCAPAAVARFRVEVIGAIRAGEPFTLRLAPEDAYGNRVTGFTSRQELLHLNATGSGKLLPATVHPAAFTDGVAELQALYTRAEAVEITVRPAGPADNTARVIDDVVVTGGGADAVQVRLIGNAPLTCRDVRLAEPRVLMADLPGATLAGDARKLTFTTGPLAQVLLTQEAQEPVPVVRLTVALRDPVDYTLLQERNLVTFAFARLPEPAGALPVTPAAPVARGNEGIVYLGGAAVITPAPVMPVPVFVPPAPPVAADAVRSVDYHLSKAEGFIRLERYSEALREAEAALALDPREPRALELQRRLRRLVLLFQPPAASPRSGQ